MKKKTVDRIFMIMYGVIGLVIFILASKSLGLIHSSCDSNVVRSGLTTIMAVSAILVTVAVSYMFCNWRGGDCYTEDGDDEISEIYMYISAFISGGLVVLLSVILGKLKGDCIGDFPGATDQEKNDGKTLKFNIWAMIVLSSITLLGSIGGLWYISSYIPPQLKGKKEKGKKEVKDTGNNWWGNLLGGDDDDE